jgi:glucose-1-phosphatase
VQNNIKNIIFDLGGVILDLDVPRTLESFSKLSGIGVERVRSVFTSASGFEEYEKGLLTDAQFRDFVRDVYEVRAKDDQIDACWNAMLCGFPVQKLELLDRLKEQYNVVLLSNTNNIHHHYINHTLMPAVKKGKVLEDYFHKVYYSHRMLKRKPEPEIYQQVLDECNFIPAQTVLLDDNQSNVAGARMVGIHSVFVDNRDFILTYFK